MVKVREDHPIREDGTVDLGLWVKRLQQTVEVDDPQQLLEACEFSFELEQKAIAAEIYWAEGASSFSTGLEMAEILAELHLDQETLVAALLYRAVREGQIGVEVIAERFGDIVAKLIEGVLRMAAISAIHSPAEQTVLGKASNEQVENVRKMLVSLVDDVRVALIKLAERTCAIRAVKDVNNEKRRRVAREVFDIYAPLAHRLGIGHIKWELEDLSFRYLEGDDYKKIAKLLDEKRLDREQYISDLQENLERELSVAKIDAEISGRVKHIYSIWRKMRRKGIGFSQVYDIRAVRVLVPEESDCYRVLGIVHSLWRNIPREFDDYVATPKDNGYRSLHTAVIGPAGKVVEVQIRTHEMHEEAEFGVCAHWRYKGTDTDDSSRSYEEKIAWLRQVLDWQEEMGGLGGLAEQLQLRVSQDRIYVFTPEGHVVDLEQGATPVDFAYSIHTEVGHSCRGAKVNGRIVPLTYVLKTADQVEILTSKEPQPSRDWLITDLGYITTSKARAKIQNWFKLQDRERRVAQGQSIIRKEFKRLALMELNYGDLAQHLNFKSSEDMFAAVGGSDLTVSQVLNAAQSMVMDALGEESLPLEPVPTVSTPDKEPDPDVDILGVGNLMTRLANCCKPVPGDAIVGYITVGRGVSIHRQDCDQVLQLQEEEPERIIQVGWGSRPQQTYPVDVAVTAYDRFNLLRDITDLLGKERINIRALNSLTDQKENTVAMTITVEISTLNELSRVLKRLNSLPNISSARRKN